VGEARTAVDVFVSDQRAAAGQRAIEKDKKALSVMRTRLVVTFLRHVGMLQGAASSKLIVTLSGSCQVLCHVQGSASISPAEAVGQGVNKRLRSAPKTTVFLAINEYVLNTHTTAPALSRDFRSKQAFARASAIQSNTQ
jgi:hypothetical protein